MPSSIERYSPLQAVFGIAEFPLQVEQPTVGRLALRGLTFNQWLQEIGNAVMKTSERASGNRQARCRSRADSPRAQSVWLLL